MFTHCDSPMLGSFHSFNHWRRHWEWSIISGLHETLGCVHCMPTSAWSVNKMIVLNEYNKGLIARASHNLTTFVGQVNFRLTNRIKGSSRWTWITWLINRHGAVPGVWFIGTAKSRNAPPALKSRSVGLGLVVDNNHDYFYRPGQSCLPNWYHCTIVQCHLPFKWQGEKRWWGGGGGCLRHYHREETPNVVCKILGATPPPPHDAVPE